MSLSYWLHSSAVRGTVAAISGLLIAGLALYFGWRFWPDEPPSHRPQAFSTESDYLAKNLDEECRALLAALSIPDQAPAQTGNCKDKEAAQRYNYASIQQAIRSADAAAYAAYIAYLQTCIGIVGAMLVTATLTASAIATWAAYTAARGTIDAATATRDSVELARREFAVTHRPRLRVRKVIVPSLQDGQPIAIQAEIFNAGSITAFLRQAIFRVEARPRRTIGAALQWVESESIGAGSTKTAGEDGVPVAKVELIKPGQSILLRLTTSLHYRSGPMGFLAENMILRGDIEYHDTYAGSDFDVRGRMSFEPTYRRVAFERFFDRHERSGVIWFAKAKEPDPEHEYED